MSAEDSLHTLARTRLKNKDLRRCNTLRPWLASAGFADIPENTCNVGPVWRMSAIGRQTRFPPQVRVSGRSFAVTASAIVQQDVATQAAIRASLERRAAAYRTPAGLVLPIAFKIGSGQRV
jgi:hypothetical protein